MPITARTGHRSKNPGDGRASPGIWPVFRTAADDGGITGPVPAQTCGQAAVTLTWMPRRRARRPAASGTTPSIGLAQAAGRVGRAARRARDADPPTDSTIQRGPCPSGRVGKAHADWVGRRVGTSAGSAADTHSCLFSELRGQCCSSGGCPATAADWRRIRKVQLGRSIAVWPRPEHYRKRTCGADPAAQFVLAAARCVSLILQSRFHFERPSGWAE